MYLNCRCSSCGNAILWDTVCSAQKLAHDKKKSNICCGSFGSHWSIWNRVGRGEGNGNHAFHWHLSWWLGESAGDCVGSAGLGGVFSVFSTGDIFDSLELKNNLTRKVMATTTLLYPLGGCARCTQCLRKWNLNIGLTDISVYLRHRRPIHAWLQPSGKIGGVWGV